jgi:hypothetical protein
MNRNEKILTEIKEKLGGLLSSLPSQFALEDTKYYLKKALASIDLVENKRRKRQQQQMEQSRMQMGFASMANAQNALKILDDMLASEQNNLKAAENQQQDSKLLNG